ncbi:50S ribosomal protein L30e [Candidatus Marsarchaeota archaeon]|nr:50S ribosomal protein L30e [Candidatus Marsarchaeota archaeon]
MIQPNDIRLAVDSGDVALGARQVIRTIEDSSAKLVVIASGNKTDAINDIKYVSGISGIRLEVFAGNSMDLGAVCGKPYSVSVLAVIDPGNSNVLNAAENNAPAKSEEKADEEREKAGAEEEEANEAAEGEEQEEEPEESADADADEAESDEAQEINEQSD